MKVFWSWQSDTPGKIGRHFVRDALAEAIKILKQPSEIEEPTEREVKDALELDHDRRGVPGSPDLAPTIFKKIDQAAVFVADVTLIGTAGQAKRTAKPHKRLINSNVAIEYGYALRSLSDASILMVQNVHYGDREGLPFDLKHKAGPILYNLSPEAKKPEMDAERTKLTAVLVEALKPYLKAKAEIVAPFSETPTTINAAYFWNPTEIIATTRRQGGEHDDGMDYFYNESRTFYLRLIPTLAPTKELPLTRLSQIMKTRRPLVLERTVFGSFAGRNRFGAINFSTHGISSTPTGFSQLFRNGEIWGVSHGFIVHHAGQLVIPIANVQNIYARVLADYIAVAKDEIGVQPPYTIELGAVGLSQVCVSLPPPNVYQEVSQPIYENTVKLRQILTDIGVGSQDKLVREFIGKLYDLADISVEA
jgi:hypothetical protein